MAKVKVRNEEHLVSIIRDFMLKQGKDAGVFAVAKAIFMAGKDSTNKPLSRKMVAMGNRLFDDAQRVTSLEVAQWGIMS